MSVSDTLTGLIIATDMEC